MTFGTAVTAVDPNGDNVTYDLVSPPFVGLSIDSAGVISYAGASAPPAGTYALVVSATSMGITGGLVSVTRMVQLVVEDVARDVSFDNLGNPNSVDHIEGVDGSSASISLGQFSAVDPNGDTLITFDLDGPAGNTGSANPTTWDVSVTLQGVSINDLGGAAFHMVEDGVLIAEPDIL